MRWCMGQAMAQWYLAPQKKTHFHLIRAWLNSWNRAISWGRCSPEWSAHTGASKGPDVRCRRAVCVFFWKRQAWPAWLWYSCFQVRAFKQLTSQTCSLFINSARISLKSSTMTARWTGVCNWHTSRNERSAWSSCHAEVIFLNCAMPCWNFQRFQVIMKVRSKADLRSALMRTLILGVLFGLTFLQIEKTQSDTWHPKMRQTEQVIGDSSFGAWWLAFLEYNCVDKTAVQPTPWQKSTNNLVWHFGHWLPSPGPFHHQRLHLLHDDDGSHEHCNLSQKSRFADLMSCDLCFFAITRPSASPSACRQQWASRRECQRWFVNIAMEPMECQAQLPQLPLFSNVSDHHDHHDHQILKQGISQPLISLFDIKFQVSFSGYHLLFSRRFRDEV